MATLIGTDTNTSITLTMSAALPDIQIGDIIVVGCEQFIVLAPPNATCTDSLGNVYSQGFTTNGPGFGEVTAFYCKATHAGAATITAHFLDVPFGGRSIAVANYRDAGNFDQVSFSIGYGPSTAPWVAGSGTGVFNLADTLIVTFTRDYFQTLLHSVSGTGDTIQARINDKILMLDRHASGPGNTAVGIETADVGANLPIVTMTFSKPLARPGGLTDQYAIRGGLGFDNREPNETASTGPWGPIGTAINRPLVASLPYQVQLGTLVLAAVFITSRNPNNSSGDVFASDNYGNSYTRIITTTDAGGTKQLAVFYTVLGHLPPSGEVFQISLTVGPIGSYNGVYQTASIAIKERVVSGTPSVFAAAGFKTDALAGAFPTQTLQLYTNTINSVPNGAYLFAAAMLAPTANQYEVSWSALESYSLIAQEGFIQFDPQGANFFRCGAVAIEDKTTPGAGNYDAQILMSAVDAVLARGSALIVLIAIVIGAASGGWIVQEA